MGHIRLGAAGSPGATMSVGLSACSPGSGTSSNSVSPQSGATPRPQSPAGLPTGGLPGDSKGGSAGSLPPGARVANLPIAKTITNSDTSTSVVIDGSGPAITCGKGTQKAKYLPGNSLAQFAFGAGTKLSIQDDPTASAAASPLTYVSSSNPPFVLLHGSADTLPSPSQTLILHDALRAKGAQSTRYVVNGANHGELAFLSGDATLLRQWSSQQVMGVIIRFPQKHLG